VINFADGRIFKGEFNIKKGLIEGKGKITFENGDYG
jgi:hypothetical protein